jgi:hypothetical protein
MDFRKGNILRGRACVFQLSDETETASRPAVWLEVQQYYGSGGRGEEEVDGVVDPNIRVIEVERGGQRLRCHRLYGLAREGLEPKEEMTRDGGLVADLVDLIHNAATKLGDKASLWVVFQSSQGS